MSDPTKFNPFRPGSLVAPGMFAGRVNEIIEIERSLLQTKNGNPRHFIIEGERGIGKSSLMYYVQLLSSGKIKGFDEGNFNFITLDIELNANSSGLEILRKLGSRMRMHLAQAGDIKVLAKAVWDFVSSWKVLGIEYKRDSTSLDPIESAEELAQALSDLIQATGHIVDGVLILIDEADKPSPEESHLGEICKLLTERLTRLGCDRVCIGMAGLPSLVGRLRASHESSPRIFETLTLGALTHSDCDYVLQQGLSAANKVNKSSTSVTESARSLLASMSEGYPHFLQQMAYSAFEQDKNNIVDDDDVYGSIYRSGGAIYQLGRRYFQEIYYERISSPDYRAVLLTMANHLDGWVSRQEIISESGVRESQVNNALNALKSRGIILLNEQAKGEYRLPTKSFAVWLKITGDKPNELLGLPASS